MFSGNGGDLGIGLPLESFHNGQSDEHQPLRLLAVIAAPQEMISKVIAKHPLLQQIFGNQWMHLIALDGGQSYQLGSDLQWQRMGTSDLSENHSCTSIAAVIFGFRIGSKTRFMSEAFTTENTEYTETISYKSLAFFLNTNEL